MDLSTLNDSQREAVLFCDAPMLVIAGAGSGKTRVLTYKIAHLMELGLEPWQIMALTFTNKAAREMKERIALQVGQERAAGLWMGTFHSVFCRMLRMESQLLGYPADFTIYDAADSKNLVRQVLKEMGLDEKQYRPAAVCGAISRAKNALVLPADYATSALMRGEDDRRLMPRMHDVYAAYCRRLRGAGVMDFDDILVNTWVLLSQHADVADKYSCRFRYLLVDEYQDTNYAQHQIVRLLSGGEGHVCVVGDDAQSIYSFRGANIGNILEFQRQFEGARLFKLEQNYRSTQTIVDAANSLIDHNSHRIPKQVYSMGDQGEKILYRPTFSDMDEAGFIRRHLQQLARECHLDYSQMAVLYRTNAQSRALEEALRKGSVPYRIFGGLSFYQRKEVKDVLAYLRLTLNPNDEEAFRRVVNYPARGIGNTTLQRVTQFASDHEMGVGDALVHLEEAGVGRAAITRLTQFREMMDGFRARMETDDCATLAWDIVDRSGIRRDIFTGTDAEAVSRQEILQALMDNMGSFVKAAQEEGSGTLLRHYLQEVSLLSDMDTDDSVSDDRVTLMTIHSAKGLEFEAVVVAGLEEGLFPSEMAIEHHQVEEERRLMYVAMTRAKRHLLLTSAKSHFRYGRTEFFEPSRFLAEIAPQYVNGPSDAPRSMATVLPKPSAPVAPCLSAPLPSSSLSPSKAPLSISLATPNSTIRVGMRVEHERFGLGTVQQLEDSGVDAKAIVLFDNAGTKRLFLRFARLNVRK